MSSSCSSRNLDNSTVEGLYKKHDPPILCGWARTTVSRMFLDNLCLVSGGT